MLQPTTVLIFSGSRNSQLLSVVIESTLPRAFRATILLSAEIPPRLSREALTNGALGSRAKTQRRFQASVAGGRDGTQQPPHLRVRQNIALI